MSGAMEEAARAGGPPSLAVEGRTAVLRLNRPALHNRLTPADLTALGAALSEAERDRSLRALVLTASGRSFCSGFDIGSLGDGRVSVPAGAPREEGDTFEHLADRLERFRLPTICALNGSVYGGATDLALACDVRLGVAGMVMLMPAARLGLHYYRGGMQRYVSRLGVDAAKRLFLFAETQDVGWMLRTGFLHEVLEDGKALMVRAMELAQAVAGRAPRAVQAMKRGLNDLARGDADLPAIEAAAHASAGSDELREGRAAWLEKRAPRFEDP